jgi:hypothetical protein
MNKVYYKVWPLDGKYETQEDALAAYHRWESVSRVAPGAGISMAKVTIEEYVIE